MGSLLLKLHTKAQARSEYGPAHPDYITYYFREASANRGVVQLSVEIRLDEAGRPTRAHCCNYAGFAWLTLFEKITPESTDKFAWTNEKGEPDPDALAESIAITAFALLR